MSEEEIKKIAKEEFMNNVMEQLDSTLIFTYIQNLGNQLQQKENIIKEVREEIKDRIERNKDISYIEITNKAYVKEQEELLEILDKGD